MDNNVLLTGAGFSNNFGGPLASEVSTIIFNNTSNPELVQLLKDDFDYENVYQKIIQSNDYSETIKSELNSAIKKTYELIDEMITKQSLSQYICIIRFKRLLNLFKKIKEPGFIFTLNQDLLFENNDGQFYDLDIRRPFNGSKIEITNYNILETKHYFTVSDTETEEAIKEYEKQFAKQNSHIFYIKLHGSQDWFKSNDDQIMIIGHGKSERIESERLLKWYLEKFNKQLSAQDTKLLIIGYSFGDIHINQAIYDNRENIKISVIDTQQFSEFCTNLSSKPLGDQIKPLIFKYYPISLVELIGKNTGTPHPYWDQLLADFSN